MIFCYTKYLAIMSKEKDLKVNGNQIANLPEVDVIDSTVTKGKVSGNFTITEQSALEEKTEKIDKNQLFSVELSDYFCPVKFDSSELEANLSPLVASGILSEDAKAKAIETAKKEFLAKHENEINAANNLTFAEVLAKLQENETLYKKVLTACNVTELKESNYVENGKVLIYRANQCTDKEGNNRYQEATVRKTTENGKVFEVPLFVESREQTTANVLLSIRYYSSKQNATKSLLNKIADYNRILTAVYETAKKAKENGFSMEQITEQITKVFATDEI